MRNASNTAVYTGSNTVILRTALEEIGGFPYDTVTEDFETSLASSESRGISLMPQRKSWQQDFPLQR